MNCREGSNPSCSKTMAEGVSGNGKGWGVVCLSKGGENGGVKMEVSGVGDCWVVVLVVVAVAGDGGCWWEWLGGWWWGWFVMMVDGGWKNCREGSNPSCSMFMEAVVKMEGSGVGHRWPRVGDGENGGVGWLLMAVAGDGEWSGGMVCDGGGWRMEEWGGGGMVERWWRMIDGDGGWKGWSGVKWGSVGGGG
ncbi:hypothetical protein BC829DRAFT_424202 [Chytridium lagenaria]|nr:hypothetical protein BC829DRAFT_424202 [Chytridium lagenaria]